MTYCVYRLLSTDTRVLYVGSTQNLITRLRDHARTQPWWGSVASVWVDGPYESRADMLLVEQAAIANLKPLHNKVRWSGRTPQHAIRVTPEEWAWWTNVATEAGMTVSDAIRHVMHEWQQEAAAA